jgi:preprotein translocase subunit Sec63
MATVLYVLSLLGVVAVARDDSPSRMTREDSADDASDVLALDLSAIRERVRARMNLVGEADYFTLLGISRDATGYEIRRAFAELRRSFEPSTLLTPELADLADDVRTIIVILEEAYEILRDTARRERYRRALGDPPA